MTVLWRWRQPRPMASARRMPGESRADRRVASDRGQLEHDGVVRRPKNEKRRWPQPAERPLPRPDRPQRGRRAAGVRTQALRRAEQRLCQTMLLNAPAAGSVAVGTRRARSALGHAQRALQGDAGRARSPAACAEAPAHQLHPLVESASEARGRVSSRSSGDWSIGGRLGAALEGSDPLSIWTAARRAAAGHGSPADGSAARLPRRQPSCHSRLLTEANWVISPHGSPKRRKCARIPGNTTRRHGSPGGRGLRTAPQEAAHGSPGGLRPVEEFKVEVVHVAWRCL